MQSPETSRIEWLLAVEVPVPQFTFPERRNKNISAWPSMFLM